MKCRRKTTSIVKFFLVITIGSPEEPKSNYRPKIRNKETRTKKRTVFPCLYFSLPEGFPPSQGVLISVLFELKTYFAGLGCHVLQCRLLGMHLQSVPKMEIFPAQSDRQNNVRQNERKRRKIRNVKFDQSCKLHYQPKLTAEWLNGHFFLFFFFRKRKVTKKNNSRDRWLTDWIRRTDDPSGACEAPG